MQLEWQKMVNSIVISISVFVHDPYRLAFFKEAYRMCFLSIQQRNKYSNKRGQEIVINPSQCGQLTFPYVQHIYISGMLYIKLGRRRRCFEFHFFLSCVCTFKPRKGGLSKVWTQLRLSITFFAS